MSDKKDAEARRSFKAGELLFKEGDKGGELWIVQQGEVEVYRDRAGRTFSLGRVAKGELLGTMTATNGGPRTASARAVTEVEVSIVGSEQMQKLIKSIPSWANSFIKDLVARVNHANDLYVEAELSAQTGLSGPVDLTLRVAMMLAGMADLIAAKVNGHDEPVVPLDVAVDRLAMMLGFKEEIRKVLQILIHNGQLTKAGEESPARFVTAQSALELRLITDLIVKAQSLQTTPGVFSLPLAQGQRKMLAELARFGFTRTAGGSDPVVMPLREIEDEFRRNKLGLIDPDALQRASALGYLTLNKQAEQTTVQLDPNWLDYALRVLEALSQILTQVGGQVAKKRVQANAAT